MWQRYQPCPPEADCLSQGKTKEEALKNIKEAIGGWLEVMESRYTFDLSKAIEVVV